MDLAYNETENVLFPHISDITSDEQSATLQSLHKNAKRCNKLFMMYDGGVLGKETGVIVLPLH